MLKLDVEYQRGDFTLRAQAELDDGVSGIYGPSGAGKSTLLALIAGLLCPARGSILFDGERLAGDAGQVFVPAHRRHFGLVFQDGQLFPHMTVLGNLRYGMMGLEPAERRFSLDAITDMLEIGALLQRKPGQLSGGERQRVALGRALLYAPRLLLLDEPLAALDPRLKGQILPYLKRVRDEIAIPMIYVSHVQEELRYLTERLYEMDAGLLRVASPAAAAGPAAGAAAI